MIATCGAGVLKGRYPRRARDGDKIGANRKAWGERNMLGEPGRLNEVYAANYPYQPRTETVLPLLEAGDIDSFVKQLPRPIPWLAIALGLYFAVTDWAVLPLTWVFDQSDWGALGVFVSFGAILAQIALLAGGVVFGPGQFWKRLICFWAGVVVFSILWSMGFVLMTALRGWSSGSTLEDDLRFMLLSLPLAGAAIQSPLWFFRLYRGWRLVKFDDDKPESPLAIRDYLIGTAIVAFSITLARLAAQPHNVNDDYWGVWCIFFGISAIMSLVSVMPALPLILRCDWRVGLVALVLYAAGSSIAFLAIAEYFGTNPISPFNVWEAADFVAVFVSFAVFLSLGLKAVRDAGLRLVTRKKRLRSG
jgi:hypothetical protein